MISCCYRGGGTLKSDLAWPGESGGWVRNDLMTEWGLILIQTCKPQHRMNKIR